MTRRDQLPRSLLHHQARAVVEAAGAAGPRLARTAATPEARA